MLTQYRDLLDDPDFDEFFKGLPDSLEVPSWSKDPAWTSAADVPSTFSGPRLEMGVSIALYVVAAVVVVCVVAACCCRNRRSRGVIVAPPPPAPPAPAPVVPASYPQQQYVHYPVPVLTGVSYPAAYPPPPVAYPPAAPYSPTGYPMPHPAPHPPTAPDHTAFYGVALPLPPPGGWNPQALPPSYDQAVGGSSGMAMVGGSHEGGHMHKDPPYNPHAPR